eukprot:1146288-Pelagomonas_calceolata.AAC.3
MPRAEGHVHYSWAHSAQGAGHPHPCGKQDEERAGPYIISNIQSVATLSSFVHKMQNTSPSLRQTWCSANKMRTELGPNRKQKTSKISQCCPLVNSIYVSGCRCTIGASSFVCMPCNT